MENQIPSTDPIIIPPKQRGPVKTVTAIIISLVYLFILIVFCGLAVIGINYSNEELSGSNAAATDRNSHTFSASGEIQTVSFRDSIYKQSYHHSTDDMELFELIKDGENSDNWSEIITLIRYEGGANTLSDVDEIAESTKNNVEEDGGFILDAFTKKDEGGTMPKNYLFYSNKYEEDNAVEVTFQKFYLRGDLLLSDMYIHQFVGKSTKEAGAEAIAFIDMYKNEISDMLRGTDLAKDYWIN